MTTLLHVFLPIIIVCNSWLLLRSWVRAQQH